MFCSMFVSPLSTWELSQAQLCTLFWGKEEQDTDVTLGWVIFWLYCFLCDQEQLGCLLWQTDHILMMLFYPRLHVVPEDLLW